MHNIDRNMLEADFEGNNLESGSFETSNFEFQQYEQLETGQEMWPGELEEEFGYETEIFDEADEMELAAELLEITSEQELDQFLGKLIRRAGRAVGSFIKSPVGRAIGGVLKGVAKKALPLAGGALGTMVGGPLGGMIGRGLANAAGNAIGLEQELLSQEDREFEGAKQFVRLAGQTVQQAASQSADRDPRSAAQAAVARAARRLAPGLLQTGGQGAGRSVGGAGARRTSGRWMRRGNRIVLFGV